MITLTLAPASLPEGLRVYAIGDVHGCSDRLRALHREIARDLAARPVAEAQIVHLGDYVDRGPDSAGVIETLLQPFPHAGDGPGPRVVNLMGNHEEMMLTALRRRRRGAALAGQWRRRSLASWGVRLRAGPTRLGGRRCRPAIWRSCAACN